MESCTDRSLGRLYELRATSKFPQAQEHLFQLIADHQYPIVDLANKTLTLHCEQLEGFGDIAQTFLVAKKIQKRRPDIQVRILIKTLHKKDQETVRNIFPMDHFPTEFVPGCEVGDYYKKAKEQFSRCVEEGYTLGIAAGVGGYIEHRHPHLRTVKEYGFSFHPDTKGTTLSMGLLPGEEGLLFPDLTKGMTGPLQTEWLKEALLKERNLYHMYMHQWENQVVALYTVTELEKENEYPFNVLIPLQFSLKQLFEWGAIDPEYLKTQGIGKLTRITKTETESIELGEGKEIRLLSGAISKLDMEILQSSYSEDFFGCTGDLSLSESMALDKFPFYEICSHKQHFFHSMVALAKEKNLFHFANFLESYDRHMGVVSKVYEKFTRRKVCFYDPGASFDLKDADSVPRLSMPTLRSILPAFAKSYAEGYRHPALLEECRAFNAYVKESCNFESRLMDIVNRGLWLTNYPHLIPIEQELKDRFSKREVTEETVISTLSASIEQCLTAARAPSTDASSVTMEDTE